MKILITPSNPSLSFVLVDTNTRKVQTFESTPDEADLGTSYEVKHRPFGITWDYDHVYVANRRFICRYDHNLKFQDKLGPFLEQNPHQIACYSGRIWMAATSFDCLLEIVPTPGNTNHAWYSAATGDLCDAPAEKKDTRHVNSLVNVGGVFFVLSHNRGLKNSELLRFRPGRPETHAAMELDATKAHNLYVSRKWLTLDTGGTKGLLDFDFVSQTKRRLQFHPTWFVRGMVGNHRYVCVAGFPPQARRYNRQFCDSTLKIVDLRSFDVVDEMVLKDIGAVNDMRLAGEKDRCHHNEIPFEI